jgi:4-hydroxybenzoate polyprenyltransferase
MPERVAWRISVLAGLLVLFSALLDPRLALALVIACVVILVGYLLFQKTRRSS